MTNNQTLIQKIGDTSRVILDTYIVDRGKISQVDVFNIVNALTGFLKDTEKTSIDHSDVKDIFKRFQVGKNSRSYENWRLRSAFKHLAKKLTRDKVIKCVPVRIPKRVRRFLVFDTEDNVLKTIPFVQALQDDLLKLNLREDIRSLDLDKIASGKGHNLKKLRHLENDYICTFIASAAIFGKILFDDYHRWLIELLLGDVYFNPCYINQTFPNSNAFRRFFLPFPASAYLMRLMLFYRKFGKKLGIPTTDYLSGHIFNTAKKNEISKLFTKWTANHPKAKSLGFEKGLSISEFRKAVKSLSLVNVPSMQGVISDPPPFIISVYSNSERLLSHSYGSRNFEYLLDVKPERIDYDEKPMNNDFIIALRRASVEGQLANVVRKIASLRRELLKKGGHYAEARKSAIEYIYDVLWNSGYDHDSDDYRNLELYVWWVEHMILHENIKESSINTHASQVPRLLYKLYDIGSIDKLSLSDLVLVLSQTMYEYHSKGIKSALKKFCDYLADRIGGNFKELKWRSRELTKLVNYTTKSFVHFDELNQALSAADYFYCKYARRIRTETRDRKIEIAEQKTKALRLAIMLGYYAGMRVSEILNLKCHHFKNGRYLTIRKSKTLNGRRNIYLDLLLPKEAFEEFKTYFKDRQVSAGNTALLFFQKTDGRPGRNGKTRKEKAWNSSHVSGEIARLFSTMGFRFFRFHHLRHAFVNIMLLRWYTLHNDLNIPNTELFKHELFQEEKMEHLKTLLFGIGERRKGKEVTDFSLHALSRLVGHGSAVVTINEYVHIIDILFYMYSFRYESMSVDMDTQQLMSFLQIRKSGLPDILQQNEVKTLQGISILKYQAIFYPQSNRAGINVLHVD